MSERKLFLCPLPWLHIATTPGGSIRLCCDSEGEQSRARDHLGKDFKLFRSDPNEFQNSENFREVRQQMLNGDIPPSCAQCFSREQLDGNSSRLHFMRKYNFNENEARELLDSSGSLKKISNKSVDLRLGNNCNLQCRMCNPWSSSSLAKEFQDLNNESIPVLDWPDRFENWVEVVANQESLEDLYLTGGEPTLVENNLVLLKRMSKQQRQSVKLRINTNGTVINEEFFEEVRTFKQNEVKVSMDGIGLVNDYIRYPSKFNSILNNLERLKKLSGLSISLHFTLSCYNLLDLPKFFNAALEWGFEEPFVDIVHHPDYQSVAHLPSHFKELYVELVKPLNKKSLNSIGNYVSSDPCSKKFRELKVKTRQVDAYRGISIANYIPQFAELLDEDFPE